MRHSTMMVPLLTLSLLASVPTGAQASRDPITVRPGHVVRVALRGDSTTPARGIVQRITSDSVFIRVEGATTSSAPDTRALRLDQVSRVDVRTGHSKGISAAIGGAVLGLTAAFVVDRITSRDTVETSTICIFGCADLKFKRRISWMPGAVYPIAAGTYGWLFYRSRRGDRWAPAMIATPPLPVSGALASPARVGLRWRF